MIKREYQDLDKCVQLYKTSEGKTKEEAFMLIIKHLSNHINSIINILAGKTFTVKPQIYTMMFYGLKQCMSIKDDAVFIMTVQSIASKYTVDDWRQQIYVVVLELIKKYVHPKRTFLEFATFLLPRRVASVLHKNSKDMLFQFDCYSSDEQEDPITDNLKDAFASKPSEIYSEDALKETENEILSDYYSPMSLETMMEKYHYANKRNFIEYIDSLLLRSVFPISHE